MYKELDTKELSGKLNDARLWILGPGVGESIVILTSHGKCIVIDCVKYEDSNFTIDILRENGVKKIDILALTHPHMDHYHGMYDILSDPEISINKIWLVNAMYLRDVAAARKAIALSNDSRNGLAQANELSQIIEGINNMVLKKLVNVEYSSEHGITHQFGNGGDIAIAFGPSNYDQTLYNVGVRRILTKDMTTCNKIDHLKCILHKLSRPSLHGFSSL